MHRIFGRRSSLSLAVLLVGLLVFSGCVTMELESDFNEDGSATHSMELTLDMSELGELGEMGETDPFANFDQVEEEAEELGYRVERIEEGDIVGVRLIQDVDDSSDLGEILNNMFNAGSTEGEEVRPFTGSFEQDGDDYTLTLTVDGATLTDTAGEGLDGGEGGEGDLGELGLDMSMIFDFTYSARLPGEIDEDETNGRISEEGVVSWDIPLEGSETFTAVSSTDDGSSNLLIILVIAGVVILGLIALAAVAFFVLMGRRNSTPATATPAGTTTPPPPPPADTYTGADQPTERITPPPDEEPRDPDDRPRSY